MITLLIQIADNGKGHTNISAMGTNMGGGDPTGPEKAAIEAILGFIRKHSPSGEVIHDIEGTLDKGGFTPANRLARN